MTFTSSYSNIKVSQEVVSRKTDMIDGNIPVFDGSKKMMDSGVSANYYEEYYALAIPLLINTWTSINIVAGFSNREVDILIQSTGLSRIVGARQPGNTAERKVNLGIDSGIIIRTITDVNGNIQIFSSDLTNLQVILVGGN